MDKALYISMSGAKQNMLSQQAHANNLANVNTVGFKQDLAQARSMPVFGEYYPSRAYAMSERPATDFDQGALIETGRNLDVAVKGKGWLSVESAEGNEALTRDGRLFIDANSMLRTGSGLPVNGNGGPIFVPPADKVEIGQDGTISIIPAGASSTELAEIDRIKLVNPSPDTIEKGLDGLIHLKPGAEEPDAEAEVQLESGFLESSNVSAVEAMTEIMSLARQYELQVKVMQHADSNSESAASLLRMS
ncbi:MAG: flagellar biosynthesis protein FlgF [Proteobacteria bacterium]|nr:MAG: flagellar biosynthesis protein FlgF [Pseudomonadota bacterium]